MESSSTGSSSPGGGPPSSPGGGKAVTSAHVTLMVKLRVVVELYLLVARTMMVWLSSRFGIQRTGRGDDAGIAVDRKSPTRIVIQRVGHAVADVRVAGQGRDANHRAAFRVFIYAVRGRVAVVDRRNVELMQIMDRLTVSHGVCSNRRRVARTVIAWLVVVSASSGPVVVTTPVLL